MTYKEAITDMMNMLKKFLYERNHIKKTKMIVFNKARKCKKEEWKWEGKNLEKLSSFKYLDFIFNYFFYITVYRSLLYEFYKALPPLPNSIQWYCVMRNSLQSKCTHPAPGSAKSSEHVSQLDQRI